MTTRRNFLGAAASMVAALSDLSLPWAALTDLRSVASVDSAKDPLDLPLGLLWADGPDSPYLVVGGKEGPLELIHLVVVYENRLELYQYVAVHRGDFWYHLDRGYIYGDDVPDEWRYVIKPEDHHVVIFSRAVELRPGVVTEEGAVSFGQDVVEKAPVGSLMLRRRTLSRGAGWVALLEGHAPDGDAARLLASWTRTPTPGVAATT
jgi:hypothetical protein